jgi:hypothetical protein
VVCILQPVLRLAASVGSHGWQGGGNERSIPLPADSVPLSREIEKAITVALMAVVVSNPARKVRHPSQVHTLHRDENRRGDRSGPGPRGGGHSSHYRAPVAAPAQTSCRVAVSTKF